MTIRRSGAAALTVGPRAAAKPMPHYLVFTGRKWQNAIGKSGITWETAGVFGVEETGDEGANKACLIAAQKHGVGTCFAVEGYAWGVDTVDAGSANELGVQLDPMERLERLGAKFTERIMAALPAPAQAELEAGDDADAER